ncbi:MAG TPA: class I SAM-dependent methyltransferase [Myxococcota bacterium]|jgi:2-polyprenyl-3-methyl-5-hydroxy-6-metoxy-1,4-benzoquinol methylase|nr:class I SAM-dependent methyltransferase [Myxococcota bacterium]
MTQAPDPDKLKAYAKNVFGALGGAMTSAMICLGDRLGLYRALAGAGALSSDELAKKTGLSERWLREWLHQQGSAGVLEYRGEGRFALSPEGEAVLADESHPAFGAGMFAHMPERMAVLDKLPAAFRTGVGLPYDALGPEGARGIERGLAPWFRALLVPVVLPQLPGVVEALTRGAAVADVGCGAGVALLAMAKAFPRSEFHGYDVSEHALARAEENRLESGVSNARFHDARVEPLPADARFALVCTIDCLHDMTDPAAVMRAIRAAIRPDGTWLVVDIKAHDSYEANLAKNPMAPLMYGTSVMTCMSSALSEPGGLGLGTLGLSAKKAHEMTAAAGFTRFEKLDVAHPVNAFYAVRP